MPVKSLNKVQKKLNKKKGALHANSRKHHKLVEAQKREARLVKKQDEQSSKRKPLGVFRTMRPELSSQSLTRGPVISREIDMVPIRGA